VHAGVDQLGEQGGDQHGVAGVVELELVDGEQPVPGQRLHRRGEPEGAHQVRELDERPVRAGRRRVVPERGQQVGLADAEAAVEVDAGPALGRAGPAEQPLGLRLQPLRERGEPFHRLGLRGLRRVGLVGREAHGVEARRRHQGRHQGVGRHDGLAVDEAQGWHGQRA
jgi:hypothetical protein